MFGLSGDGFLLCSLCGEAFRRGTYGSGERTLLGQLNDGAPDVGDKGGEDVWESGEGVPTDRPASTALSEPCRFMTLGRGNEMKN